MKTENFPSNDYVNMVMEWIAEHNTNIKFMWTAFQISDCNLTEHLYDEEKLDFYVKELTDRVNAGGQPSIQCICMGSVKPENERISEDYEVTRYLTDIWSYDSDKSIEQNAKDAFEAVQKYNWTYSTETGDDPITIVKQEINGNVIYTDVSKWHRYGERFEIDFEPRHDHEWNDQGEECVYGTLVCPWQPELVRARLEYARQIKRPINLYMLEKFEDYDENSSSYSDQAWVERKVQVFDPVKDAGEDFDEIVDRFWILMTQDNPLDDFLNEWHGYDLYAMRERFKDN